MSVTKSVVLRATAAAAVGLSVLSAQLADAGQLRKYKPVCNLLKVPAHTIGNPATNDDSLIVTSADIATNAKTLTTTIRVKKLGGWPDQKALLGRSWTFGFAIGQNRVETQVVDGPMGIRDNKGLGAKVTLDKAKNEVRYSLPLSTFISHWNAPIVNLKTTLTQLRVETAGVVEEPKGAGLATMSVPFAAAGDIQSTTKTYVAGRPSCVKVGS